MFYFRDLFEAESFALFIDFAATRAASTAVT